MTRRARTNVSFPPRSSWHASHVYMIERQTYEGGGGRGLLFASDGYPTVFGTVTGDLLIFELCLVFTNLSLSLPPIVNALSRVFHHD